MATKPAIAVINASTVLTDDEVEAFVPALQKQVQRDFAPVWGLDATLDFLSSTQTPPTDKWWLVMLDNSDQAGALGYHDVTSGGLPMGKVFAATDLAYDQQWTVTASHELLEMIADPQIDLTVFVQPDENTGTLYAYEVCDACEADEFAYDIDGSLVSDFVYPAWFESYRQSDSTKFDFQDQIKTPFELLPGGYIGVFDVTSGTGWHQQTAAEAPHRQLQPPRAGVGSRRERRRTPRNQWHYSTNKPGSAVELRQRLAARR
jgi:hypothetical protein